MPISNVNSCPHHNHSHTIRVGRKTAVLCDDCHDSIMLLLSSKRVMDTFYTRKLPLDEQYKVRRERAKLYARSEVGVE